MSKIKNGGLDQYGAGPFEQQQFGTSGVKGLKTFISCLLIVTVAFCQLFLLKKWWWWWCRLEDLCRSRVETACHACSRALQWAASTELWCLHCCSSRTWRGNETDATPAVDSWHSQVIVSSSINIVIVKSLINAFTVDNDYNKCIYTPVYYVLQSQTIATGYANNKIHQEAVKIEI